MTPDQWFAATEPGALIQKVAPVWPHALEQRRTLDPILVRRMMLFGCASARMIWDFLPTDSRSSLLVKERFADGKATESDLRASRIHHVIPAITVKHHAMNAVGEPSGGSQSAAMALATLAAGPSPLGPAFKIEKWHATWNRAYDEARATQAHFLRDIFPPLEYTPQFDSAWLTSTVVALAKQMDETGDFSIVPILADALQDSGCNDETLLQCCRVAGNVHVRGNWVVDLVLGRE
jgi:hypothetical protein